MCLITRKTACLSLPSGTKNLATYHPPTEKEHPCKLTIFNGGSISLYVEVESKRGGFVKNWLESDFPVHVIILHSENCNIKTVSEYMDSLSLFRTISNHLHFNLPVLVYETHETSQCLSMKHMDLWTYSGNRLHYSCVSFCHWFFIINTDVSVFLPNYLMVC